MHIICLHRTHFAIVIIELLKKFTIFRHSQLKPVLWYTTMAIQYGVAYVYTLICYICTIVISHPPRSREWRCRVGGCPSRVAPAWTCLQPHWSPHSDPPQLSPRAISSQREHSSCPGWEFWHLLFLRVHGTRDRLKVKIIGHLLHSIKVCTCL